MSELKAQLNDIKRAWRWALALGATATALHAAVVLAAFLSGDQLLRGTDPAPALWFAAVVGAATGLTIALTHLSRRILDRAALWVDHTIARTLVAGQMSTTATPAEASDPAPQIDALRSGLSNASLVIAARAICVPAFILVLLVVDYRAAALASVIYAVGFGVALGGMSGRRFPDNLARHRARAITSSEPRHHAILRATGLDAAIQTIWSTNATKAVASQYAHLRSNGRWELAANVFAASSLTIAATLAFAAIHEAMIHRFEAVISIATIAWTIYVVRSAIIAAPSLGTIRTAWRSLVSRHGQPSRASQPSIPGVIRIDDASVQLSGRNQAALTHVTMTCHSGETIVIAGPPGSGKSALAGLIAGAVTPTEGRCQSGGLRLGYVPEIPLVLEGTVAQNIARFTRYDVHAVLAATERAGVSAVLGGLGLEIPLHNSVLQPFGSLSLREARAVNLARAVFTQIDVLVIDKPELAMEPIDVQSMLHAFRHLRAGGVGLVIASNDPRFHALADRIVHLDAGRIVEPAISRVSHSQQAFVARGHRFAVAR